MNPSKDLTTAPTIAVRMSADGRFPFSELFGRGVAMAMEAGASIRDLLCGQLGVTEEYLDGRIQTIFLNGRPVDDVAGAVVSDGDVLSLSAAMPGLVGATLRRGGHLAAMRGSISHAGHQTADRPAAGTVTVKLFNLVARELGPPFLARGVFVSAKDLAAPLKTAGSAVAEIRRDGKPVSLADLAELLDADTEVFFQVERLPDDGVEGR